MRQLLVSSLLIILAACSPQSGQSPSGLVYCLEGNPEAFNPQQTTSGTTLDATALHLYNSLLSYSPKEAAFVPELATHWQINASLTEYVFHLRDDVKFHHNELFTPSRTVNADDVVFSFQRMIDNNHPFYNEGLGQYPFFQGLGILQNLIDVEALSPQQVKFTLAQPDVTFLSNLASAFAVILSKEYADLLQQQNNIMAFSQMPIGTGPYRFIEYNKNQFIRYQRHDNYFKTVASTKHLVFDITPNSTRRLAKLVSGDCDLSALPQAREAKLLETSKKVKTVNRPDLNVAFWSFNTERPPLDNPKVRQALDLAINKKAIIDSVYGKTGQIAYSLLPPLSWAHPKTAPTQSFDPITAKALLTEAGIDNLNINIWVPNVARAYNPNAYRTAELITQDLAKIGIQAQIVSYDWSVFLGKLNEGNYDTALLGWSADNADPDNFFSSTLSCAAIASGNNRSKWCHLAFEKLLQQAAKSNDKQLRYQLYLQAHQILEQQKPMSYIGHGERLLLSHKNVHGLEIDSFSGISLDKVFKTRDQD
ncbi:ABC transporter substrate-binding protein [Paraferrimonas sp. SM1919]|uniref:ABC transporter substrate-binding protein n=1 Tax=Paraferrimonas sp. SM1919 TaxID=2662263 RepID=UPI0013D57771|nr:ABC transporter substrate-binding protein [Paraferrimonas sp. SM1919]